MFPQPRLPARQPGFHPPLLPPKQPFRFHPSCVLALLPQQDAVWWDYSGYDNHGIPYGPTPTAKGRYGFAWDLDGVDDSILVYDSPSLEVSEEITLSYRFLSRMTRETHLGHKIASDWVNYFLGYFVVLREDKKVALLWGDGSFPPMNLTSLGTYTLNSWTSLTLSLQRDERASLYLNRQLDNRVAPIKPLRNAPSPLRISPPWALLNGLLGEVRIYNQAWSPNPADPNYLPEIDPGPPPYGW